MKCSIKSTLYFHIPEEYEIAQSYKARHPEAQDESTSEYVILTRESTYEMTMEELLIMTSLEEDSE